MHNQFFTTRASRIGVVATVAVLLSLGIGLYRYGTSRWQNVSADRQVSKAGHGSRAGEDVDGQMPKRERLAHADGGQETTAVSDESLAIGISNQQWDAAARAEEPFLDPMRDGWSSEAFAQRTDRQMARLKRYVESGAARSADELASLLDPAFRSTPLRPDSLVNVYDDGAIRVSRAVPREDSDGQADRTGSDHGGDGRSRVVTAWEEQLALLGNLSSSSGRGDVASSAPRPILEWKTVAIDRDGLAVVTRVLIHVFGQSDTLSIQQNAAWRCRWSIPTDRGGGDQMPRLLSVEVQEFEEIVAKLPGRPFRDVTDDLLRGHPVLQRQFGVGLDDWRMRIDWRFGLDVTSPYGIAVGDVDGDGRDDLFVCEPGGLPNRLLLNQPDGTVRESAAEAGVDYLEPAHSALLIDLDNDGDQDLTFTSGRYVLFFANDGEGRFHRRAIHSLVSVARSMCAADFDADGFVDVYVCGYFQRDPTGMGIGIGRPVPYHDANNGAPNALLRNGGDWTFTDVTRQVGLDVNNRRFSYAAAWEDFDNDGDQDLYVANDFGRNNLYRNTRGRFTDVAPQLGVEDMSAGMSVSWGDYNRDGWSDLYVGNMFSSAGNRIAYQRQFQPGASPSTRDGYRRHARGNTLFAGSAGGKFLDVTHHSGVYMGRWAWSSNFIDINNDGWQDLIVANGMVTGPKADVDL